MKKALGVVVVGTLLLLATINIKWLWTLSKWAALVGLGWCLHTFDVHLGGNVSADGIMLMFGGSLVGAILTFLAMMYSDTYK